MTHRDAGIYFRAYEILYDHHEKLEADRRKKHGPGAAKRMRASYKRIYELVNKVRRTQ